MAENQSQTPKFDGMLVGNIGVAEWQVGLAAAVNETYTYANTSLFCAEIAGYYRDYALRYIRPCAQWLDAYVPALHQNGVTGIISTHIASKLISGLTKQITGEKLIYRLNCAADSETMQDLKFASKWANENNIHKAVKNGIGFACALGTSLLKINRRMNGSLWWEAVRFDNCFYLADFCGEVQDAKFLIRNYTDTRDNKRVQYFLVEHRYWKEYDPKIKEVKLPNGLSVFQVEHKKGERVPVVEYNVHRAQSQSLNNLMSQRAGNRSTVKWDEIPKEVRDAIKKDYAVIRIDEPQLLGFTNLGVEALLNGEGDLSVPTGTNFGESMIFGIMDDLITYEVASSYLLRDMYNGKGTVYIPKSMSLADVMTQLPAPMMPDDEGNLIKSPVNIPFATPGAGTNPFSGLDGAKFEKMPGVNPEDQSAIVQQFEVRAAEWQLIKENSLKNIAVKWGMSPKILSSFLAQGTAQMTATQIDSEDDLSIAFINLHRSYFKDPINRLMETTLNYYGKKANVDIDFASPSLINKDRLLDRTLKELEAGLIDIEEAVRIMNPDLDEEKIQEKVQKAVQHQQEMMMQQMYEMNASGGFGNNYDDLGGENLNGSTNPVQ